MGETLWKMLPVGAPVAAHAAPPFNPIVSGPRWQVFPLSWCRGILGNGVMCVAVTGLSCQD